MKLKIGRHEYSITENDEFMDNGSCVQLLTQSKENSSWGRRSNPVLSKRACTEISVFKRIDKDHPYSQSVQVFSLSLINEDQ